MEKQMKKFVDLNNLSDVQKHMLMFSYFRIKSEEIANQFPSISSSRDKDIETYRWRFASNQTIFNKLKMLEKQIQILSDKIEREKDNADQSDLNMLVRVYWANSEDYENLSFELDRIESEKRSFIDYGIDLSDLDIGFDEIIKKIKNMSADEQESVIRGYKNLGKSFGIETIPSKPQPVVVSFGE